MNPRLFEKIKKHAQSFKAENEKFVLHRNELELRNDLIFLIYKNITKQKTLDNDMVFLNILKDTVDTIYAGPPIDYVIVKKEKDTVQLHKA
ncbi:MAG: hypothetical protein ACXQTP_00460 [Candidatus Methanofastidiosia archaeon]